MFVGHFAVGFAAKPMAPKASLATLFIAGALADVLWIIFFPIGIEKVVIEPGLMAANSLNLVSIPFSHSLFADAVWAAAFAGLYYWRRNDSRAAWIIAAAVLSHWVLDAVVHRPDMQLAPWSETRIGLGLWNSRLATLIVEGGLWLIALAIYVRRTRPNGRAGIYGFWIVVGILTLLWLGSLNGDPPPSLKTLAVVDTIFFLVLFAWAAWMDRARRVLT